MRKALKRASAFARQVDVRFDAAFAVGKIMDPLTDDGIKFVGRLTNNRVLSKLVEPYIRRRAGRPPTQGYEYVVELGLHQPKSWWHAQQLILVVVDKPNPKTGQLELFPFSFILVTNWLEDEMSATDILFHYRRRGIFENRIGELSQAVCVHLSFL